MSARKYRDDQEFEPNSINKTTNEESMDFGINSETGEAKPPPTPTQIRQILAKKPKKVHKTIR